MKPIQNAWTRWIAFGQVAVKVQMRILFTAFYFLIFWMVGLVVRIFSDPLRIKNKQTLSAFSPWEHPDETLEQSRNQY
jgi:hypothetical protein